MKKIYKNQPIKEQLEKIGFAYPTLKANKKWGIRGSSLLDEKTEEGCLKRFLNYLNENNLIEVI